MKKCLDLLSDLLNEHAEKKEKKSLPGLQLRRGSLADGVFDSEYSAGVVTIAASSELSSAYGVSLLSCALQAGHCAEFLGVSTPQYPVRPLWIGSSVEVVISPRVSIYLPKFMLDEKEAISISDVCIRLIEGGYNFLLFGSKGSGGCGNVEKVALNEGVLAKINRSFLEIKKLVLASL